MTREEELARALLNGRARIIEYRRTSDRGYNDFYGGTDRRDRRGYRNLIEFTIDINEEPLTYEPLPMPSTQKLAEVMKTSKEAEQKAKIKNSLEKLILLTKITVLAWADSLDDSTKRVAVLDMK